MIAIHLSSEPEAPPSAASAISDRINADNMRRTGVHAYRPLAIFLRDEDDRIRGGVTGGVWGG